MSGPLLHDFISLGQSLEELSFTIAGKEVTVTDSSLSVGRVGRAPIRHVILAAIRLVFEHIPIIDNNEPLVELRDYHILSQPMYHEQGITSDERMCIRRGVAEKLKVAETSFSGAYCFKVWDGHRPRSLQDAIYTDFRERIQADHPDWNDSQLDHETEQFVTRATTQKRIPPHATGGAVDLTLVDADGNELDMGTVFDHFGPEAEPFYFKDDRAHADAHRNRMLLRNAMLGAGFVADDDEWWHFDYGDQAWAMRAEQDYAVYSEV